MARNVAGTANQNLTSVCCRTGFPLRFKPVENASVKSLMKSYRGSCHCGKVKLTVKMNLDHVRVCDCSVCIRRGALNHRVPKNDLILESRWEELSLYEWGSKTAKDYFCPTCGILPFRRPSNPSPREILAGAQPFNEWAVNVRCLEGINIENIPTKHVKGSEIEFADS